MFEPHKRIVGFANANKFIELHLDRSGVTILRILNQENHQKRNDSCSSVDDKLPCVREMEERTRDCPDHHGPEGEGKDPGSSGFAGSDLRNFSKQLAGGSGLLGRRDEDRRFDAVLFVGGSWHGVTQLLLRLRSINVQLAAEFLPTFV